MSSANGDDKMFDDDFDDLFGHPEDDKPKEKEDDRNPLEAEINLNDDDEDEDDENEFSITKIKAQVGFVGDEFVGVKKATQGKRYEDDDAGSVESFDDDEPISDRTKTYNGGTSNVLTEAQKPFQPTSSPATLSHRFMVWNNVGTIRCYNTEDDDGIDVTFVDAGHHQPIHLRNTFDYTMGTLSNDAVVLACLKDKDHPSKLFCINYTTWDTAKEWTIDMEPNEEILGIGIGESWIAAATDLNRLRIFSLSGIQHFTYEIPGRIVAIAGFNSLLFLTYHYGIGVNESQSISYAVLTVKGSTLTPLIQHLPIPLTPRSILTWIGFSEEGTPAFSDSSDCLRILNGQLWTPFCNMRELLTGPNDHFWVVGIGQLTQTIRAVKCKGALYPPTLPRPTELILDAKIPLCEIGSEKSRREDAMLRALLMRAISKKMDNKGFDMDEYRQKALLEFATANYKLFELSVKEKRDFRGSEYISMTPSVKGIENAVRFASQNRKTALMERLRKMALQKIEDGSEDEEDYDDFEKVAVPSLSIASSHNYSMSSSFARLESNGSFQNSVESRKTLSLNASSTAEVVENPLLRKQKEEIRSLVSPSFQKSNPFKKIAETDEPVKEPSVIEAGFAFIDAWKKPTEKSMTDTEFNPKHTGGKGSKKKAQGQVADKGKDTNEKNKNKKKQKTLFDMRGTSTSKRTTADNAKSNPTSPTISVEVDSKGDDSSIINSESFTEQEIELQSEQSRPQRAAGTKRKRNIEEYDEEEVDLNVPFSSLTHTTTENGQPAMGFTALALGADNFP